MTAPVQVLPPDAPREEWLKARTRGLGASDAAAVVGMSKWRGPVQVWMEKTGEVDVVANDASNEYQRLGQLLEPIILGLFTERTGIEVEPGGLLRHHETEWLLATPDGLAGDNAVVQAKNVAGWKEDEWEDGVPDEYQIQVLHELAVTGRQRAHLAVLFGGNHFEPYVVERDENTIATLLRMEQNFWIEHVLARKIPPMSEHGGLDALVTTGLTKELDPEALIVIEACEAARAAAREAEDLKRRAEQTVQALLLVDDQEVAEVGRINGKEVVTWKEQSRTDVDARRLRKEQPDVAEEFQRVSTFRVLRPKSKNVREEHDG